MIPLVFLVLSLLVSAPEPGAGNQADLTRQARTLAAATDASLARGDYQAGIRQAQEAFALHEQLGAHADAAWDLNAIGLANQYLGHYEPALAEFRRALALDRAAASRDGEVTRLNNIGTVHFLQGRYSDALALYQEALGTVDAVTAPAARGRLRKMTLSNLAALHQRLGADERALDLYAQVRAGETMQPAEEAQLLVNQGALARRLGDPSKARELYRSAQQLFARAAHRDGEIGAWRNIGIVAALDFADYGSALDAFNAGLHLARASSNRRGEAQALLYRGEALRRMRREDDARGDLQAALDAATAASLIEEQWKALYGLGLVAEAQGDRRGARDAFERAIAAIESVRSDLRTVALRSEFLADKRDVYDALIWLRLNERPAPLDEIFRLFEQSRSRAWRDRLLPNADAPPLAAVQAALPDDTVLLEYWTGSSGMAVLWMSHSHAGLVTRTADAEDARAVQQLGDAVARRDGDWRPSSKKAGDILLSQLPPLGSARHLLVVPDGPLHAVPFEALTIPATSALLVERADVSYLPAASFVVLERPRAARGWSWPWQRELVAFGNPASAPAPLETRQLPPLPYADEEVRRIAHVLRGRADVHLGADARKQFVTDGRLRTTPIVHFSTHAIADTRDPDRSRVLLAAASPGAPADYLFLREVNELDLSGVSLVTLSACRTERGRIVRGEGVEGFSRALLAAGAAAAVTTMWDVADRPSAELMTQFYAAAAGGAPKAAALRQAKLQFLGSGTAWAHPYYWAGYLLSGNGHEPLPRVVPWPVVSAAALLILLAVSAALRATATARRSTGLRRRAG